MIIFVLIDTSILVLLMSSFLKGTALKQTPKFLVPVLTKGQVSSQKVWVKAIFTGGDPDLWRHVLNNDRRPATRTHRITAGHWELFSKRRIFISIPPTAGPRPKYLNQ
jgi:hypothetical protein